MATTARTFRIFVSSTFSDLAAERNVLQERVFPRLRDLCLRNHARFQAIDLRWGVSEEAGLDQRTMDICLEEIDRCRSVSPKPNFIVLLGDRYGWRPLPAEIPADEFHAIRERVTDEKDQKRLEHWYPRDENARFRRHVDEEPQPVHALRPREVNLANLKAREKEAGEWHGTEAELRRILLGAIDLGALDEVDLRGDDRENALLKYRVSATGQEIARGALRVRDAPEHVFCFFRTIPDLDLGHERAGAFTDLLEAGTPDGTAKAELVDLKRALGKKAAKVFPMKVTWAEVLASQPPPRGSEGANGSPAASEGEDPYEGLPDHLRKLCRNVDESLRGVIEAQLTELKARDENPLEVERAAHRAFAADRADERTFVGRGTLLGQIAEYVDGAAFGEPRPPLAVVGASGAGKSAVMARAAQQADERKGPEVIMRYIGWTPASSTGRDLLDSVLHDVSDRYKKTVQIPSDYRGLVEELPKGLALATGDRPLVVFLDALDQLGTFDPARTLSWIPTQLPPYVSLIVSTRAEEEYVQPLMRRVPRGQIRELEPLSKIDGKDLLERWLDPRNADRPSGRWLQEDQFREVLAKFAREDEGEGLPLYLKLAFEESRRWRSEDRIGKEIKQLPNDVSGIVGRMFDRLSDDAIHGVPVVERSLAYLAAARSGLSEDEIIDMLSLDEDVLADFQRRQPKSPKVMRLPVVIWSRLFFDLEPYLAERTVEGASLLAFYHRQLLDVVSDRYLGEVGSGTRKARHAALAEYFAKQPLDLVEATAERAAMANRRKLIELPYQQTMAQEWEEVERTLTDFGFLERKAVQVGALKYHNAEGEEATTYGGIYQIRDDFELALQMMPGGDGPGGGERKRIIVTGVDFGKGGGYVLQCPHCKTVHKFQDKWQGDTGFACPNCKGPLSVNDFVVPPAPGPVANA